MIRIIKDYSLKAIKQKLISLYILNILDILFTLTLINTDMFKEANSVMIPLLSNPVLAIVLKIVFIGMLVYFIIKRINNATKKQLFFSNIIVTTMICIYLLINISHIIYSYIYIYITYFYN